jgi:hypothetical protein
MPITGRSAVDADSAASRHVAVDLVLVGQGLALRTAEIVTER